MQYSMLEQHHWKFKAANWLLLACLALAVPFLTTRLAAFMNYYLIAILFLFCTALIIAVIIGYKHRSIQDNASPLEQHMPHLSGKGLTDHEIQMKLLAKGWHPHAIELVLNDLHNPKGSLEKMQRFINHQQKKGRLPEEIKEMLLDANWPEELVDLGLFS